MDPNTKSKLATLAIVLGSILSALAMHGKAALDALAGVPALVVAFANGLPLGVWSVILAFTVATLLWTALDRKRPPMDCGKPRSFSNDTITLCVALVVTSSQQWASGDETRGALLNAFWLGLVAGISAQYAGRALRSMFRRKVAP